MGGMGGDVGGYFTGTKTAQTGEGTARGSPCGVRRPVAGSMRKRATVSEDWFSARRNLPPGWMAKWREVRPRVS